MWLPWILTEAHKTKMEAGRFFLFDTDKGGHKLFSHIVTGDETQVLHKTPKQTSINRMASFLTSIKIKNSNIQHMESDGDWCWNHPFKSVLLIHFMTKKSHNQFYDQ